MEGTAPGWTGPCGGSAPTGMLSDALLPWAREAYFQSVHSVSRFLSLSNNLGNLLFARQP